jgi:hypothetical protein
MKPTAVRRSICVILFVCSTLAFHAARAEATSTLTAGAARMDITPDLRLSNWITHKPYGEKLEPIFARAVALAQGSNRVVCVSWELLYPMEGAVAEVRQRIQQRTGIPAENILISATHNHSAPWSPVIGDPLTKAEQKVLDSFLNDPLYPTWKELMLEQTVKAVQAADASRVPVTLSISRAYAGDVIFNRRPRKPDGKVLGMANPANPFVLPQGLRFGPVDPTLTILSLRAGERSVATVFNVPCHGVGVYPSYDGISGDWCGLLSATLEKQTGGEALFLQGCAGDMVPTHRGLEARTNMTSKLAPRVADAIKVSYSLAGTNVLKTGRARVKLPLEELPSRDMERDYLEPEVQIITLGDLAIVALPGEPFIGLAMAIQARSPFPHTIVAGYCNGYGTQYVGMPGEKALGGYEVEGRNLGKDSCGQLLVDTAVSLLEKSAQHIAHKP